MSRRKRVAVLGLLDGPEAQAGAGVLACLDAARFERVAILGERSESGCLRPESCERVLLLPPVGDPALAAALVEARRAERLAAILPGSAPAARVLADPDGRAAESATQLVELARRAGVRLAPRRALPLQASIAPFAEAPAWPLLLQGTDGARRLVGDVWEALRGQQSLARGGSSDVHWIAYDPQEAFEVALIVGESGQPVAGAAVRVLSDDERARPWMAVTIENRALLEAAARLARELRIRGPLLVSFTRLDGAYLLLDACAGFPLWVEACLAAGPNLVECALLLALDEEVETREPFPCTPPGVLFSQTAQDYVVETPPA